MGLTCGLRWEEWRETESEKDAVEEDFSNLTQDLLKASHWNVLIDLKLPLQIDPNLITGPRPGLQTRAWHHPFPWISKPSLSNNSDVRSACSVYAVRNGYGLRMSLGKASDWSIQNYVLQKSKGKSSLNL